MQSSLGEDGRRIKPQPADVKGPYHTARRVVFGCLISALVVTPFVELSGSPFVLLDVPARRFIVFSVSFGPQDAHLAFFAVSAAAFLLALSTSLWGRAFCGFACPQTVFLDGVFRPIERFVEGPRQDRLRRDAAPTSVGKLARKASKHALFILASALLAHSLVFLFVPISRSLAMFTEGPASEPVVFTWAIVLTALLYVDFGLFREQFCLALCPYGRLQAALVDEDTRVISYDARRGEPRRVLGRKHLPVVAHAPSAPEGDCVSCNRCVVVCPTGIDIRNGLQLDCVACTACIDACDDIMTKVGKPRGLIRFASERSLGSTAPAPDRFRWRPRLTIYAVLGAAGLGAALFAFEAHQDVAVTVLRPKGAPFVLEDDLVRNTFTVHLVEKAGKAIDVSVCAEAPGGVEATLPPSVSLSANASEELPVVLSRPAGHPARSARLRIVSGPSCEGQQISEVSVEILGP